MANDVLDSMHVGDDMADRSLVRETAAAGGGSAGRFCSGSTSSFSGTCGWARAFGWDGRNVNVNSLQCCVVARVWKSPSTGKSSHRSNERVVQSAITFIDVSDLGSIVTGAPCAWTWVLLQGIQSTMERLPRSHYR